MTPNASRIIAVMERETGHDMHSLVDGVLGCIKCHDTLDLTFAFGEHIVDAFVALGPCRGEPRGAVNFFVYRRKSIRELLEGGK